MRESFALSANESRTHKRPALQTLLGALVTAVQSCNAATNNMLQRKIEGEQRKKVGACHVDMTHILGSTSMQGRFCAACGC